MKMAIHKTGFALAFAALLFTTTAMGQACDENTDSACVDWENGVAYAVGNGAPASWAKSQGQKNVSAQRAAKVDGARALMELLKGVNISSDTSLEESMVGNDKVRVTVEGRLRGLAPGKTRYMSDGTIRITMMARLNEVIPSELYIQGEGPAPVGPPSGATGGSIDTNKVYTGLVIDARGQKIAPAMAPRILDERGEEIYSAAFVDREYALSTGVAGYSKKLDAAKNSDRVKGNPLVLKAGSGSSGSDIKLNAREANALRQIAQTQTFLKECRVMIVLD